MLHAVYFIMLSSEFGILHHNLLFYASLTASICVSLHFAFCFRRPVILISTFKVPSSYLSSCIWTGTMWSLTSVSLIGLKPSNIIWKRWFPIYWFIFYLSFLFAQSLVLSAKKSRWDLLQGQSLSRETFLNTECPTALLVLFCFTSFLVAFQMVYLGCVQINLLSKMSSELLVTVFGSTVPMLLLFTVNWNLSSLLPSSGTFLTGISSCPSIWHQLTFFKGAYWIPQRQRICKPRGKSRDPHSHTFCRASGLFLQTLLQSPFETQHSKVKAHTRYVNLWRKCHPSWRGSKLPIRVRTRMRLFVSVPVDT